MLDSTSEMCQSSTLEMLILRVPTEETSLVETLEALEFRSMVALFTGEL